MRVTLHDRVTFFRQITHDAMLVDDAPNQKHDGNESDKRGGSGKKQFGTLTDVQRTRRLGLNDKPLMLQVLIRH